MRNKEGQLPAGTERKTMAEGEIPDAPLTPEEQAAFSKLEGIVAEGLDKMEAAIPALIEIRDRRLYRAQFTTFRKYVETKWSYSVRRAYQLIEAQAVIENLCTNGAQTLPTKDRQRRELAKLPPEEQVRVWAQVIESGEKPTARKIEEVAGEIIEPTKKRATVKKPKPNPAPPIEIVPFVENENDNLKASRAMIDLWDRTDQGNRYAFLLHVFGRKPCIEVRNAMLARSKVKKKAPLG